MTIKELRDEQNLSQAEFGESIGVSAQSVGAYEKGKTKPSEKVLDKIIEVYGVAVATAANTAKSVSEKAAKAAGVAKETVSRTAKTAMDKAKDVQSRLDKAVQDAKDSMAAQKIASKMVIQSPMGGEITPEEIMEKIGPADRVYVRVDENKAYWVRGEESGSVDLW